MTTYNQTTAQLLSAVVQTAYVQAVQNVEGGRQTAKQTKETKN